MPKVSVLMSTYFKDDPDNLKLAIESIVDQTTRPTQIVLVLDGQVSSKLLAAISAADNKSVDIDTIQLESNVGLAKALNIGLTHCTSDLVVRMDADDIALPNRISDNIATLERFPLSSIAGAVYDIYDSEMKIKTGTRTPPVTPSACKKHSRFRVPFNHPTIIFRKSDILEVGGYPEDVGRFEDWALALKCLHAGKQISNSNNVVLKFRGGADLISRRSGIKYAKEEFRALTALYKSGILSTFDYIANLTLRLPVRILPPSLVQFIYNKFMHKQTAEA